MRMTPILLAAGIALAPLLPATAAADAVGDAVGDVAHAVFTAGERELIRDYYRRHPAAADADSTDDVPDPRHGKHNKRHGPPGHKNKGLPPGIAMKLERGGTLPPGIAKRNLPADLERRLPPVPAGYERQFVDGKVVLVNVATQVISDVISDVLGR